MKKTLLLLGALILSTTFATAQAQQPCPCGPECNCPPPCVRKPAPPKINLDKKLNLTEEQKVKAREIRMNGHKKIHPLFEQLKNKEDQKRALINGGATSKAQLDLIEKTNNDINVLRKQIHEIKIQNMKEFESILTDEQKKTLENIKIESRKNFKKHHRGMHRPCPLPIK